MGARTAEGSGGYQSLADAADGRQPASMDRQGVA
jgi:hypothetical protein